MPYNSVTVCACGLGIHKLVSASDRSSSSPPFIFFLLSVLPSSSSVMWEFKEGPCMMNGGCDCSRPLFRECARAHTRTHRVYWGERNLNMIQMPSCVREKRGEEKIIKETSEGK